VDETPLLPRRQTQRCHGLPSAIGKRQVVVLG